MKRQPFGERLRDALARPCFGRDLFISYSRRDKAMGYALRLAAEVRKAAARQKDPTEISISSDLWAGGPSATTHPQLLTEARRCRAFVLLATRGAVVSPNVAGEVEACLSTGRYVLTIDVDHSLDHAAWEKEDTAKIVRTMPSQAETGNAIEEQKPDEKVVERVLQIIGYETQTRRIRRIVRRTAFIGLAIIVGAYAFSSWQISQANRLRDEAKATAVAAESRSIDATARQSLAEMASWFAEKAARLAGWKTSLAEVDTEVAQQLEAEARSAAAREEEIALGLRLANESSTLLRQQPHHIERAVRLATEAMTHLDRRGVRSIAADLALRESLALLPAGFSVPLPGIGEPVASRDGQYVANTGPQGLSLCQTANGHCATLGEKSSSWSAAAFNGDASRVAAANGDKVVVFRTDTGKPVGDPFPVGGQASRLAFASDGTTLAVAVGAAFSIHDTTTGKELARPRQAGDDILGMELSHHETSELLLTVAGKRVLAWKWRTSEPPVPLPTQGQPLLATFAPDDTRVATIDSEQGLVVSKWKWPNATESWTASLPPPLHTARFSDDGKRIAVSQMRGYGVHVYDVEKSAAPITVLDVPGRWLAFSRDGSLLATGANYLAALWSLPDGRELARAAHERIPYVAFRDDGQVVSFDRGHALRVWLRNPLFSGETKIAATGNPLAVAFEPSTNRLLLATLSKPGSPGEVFRVDRDGAVQPCPLVGREHVSSMIFTPDGLLVTGSIVGRVRLWKSWCGVSAESGTEIASTGNAVDALAVSADGSRLAAASGNTLTMIDAWRGAARRSFVVPDADRSRSLAFTAGGDVVAGGFAGAVRVWPWRGLRSAGEIIGGGVTQVATAGDFVVSSGMNAATVWNRRDHSRHDLEHDSVVTSVAFDPTGRFLMTAGADQMAHVWTNWQRKDAEEVARVALSAGAKHGERDGVKLAAFSADGKWLAVVTQRQNPYVFITPWQPQEMLDAAQRSLGAAAAKPR
jgi:WD40 repeat protein